MADFLELDVNVDDAQATSALARIDEAQDAVIQGAKELDAALKASDSALGKTYSKTNAEIDKLADNIAKKFDDIERAWKKSTTTTEQALQTDVRAFAQLKRHTDLYDSPGGFTAGLGRAGSALRGVTAAFGISALAGAGFAGGLALATSQAFTAASRIQDLTSKTDLSTDAVQRFGFVAEQTGASVENMASSAFKLGVTLSRGGTAVARAVDDLGLSLSTLRELNPEAQFDAIARALSKITNTQDRNRLGVQLFGRAYEQIAPAIKEYGALIDDATFAAQQNIEALDRWGDKTTTIGARVKATWIDVIGTILRGLETIPTAATKAAEDTADALGHLRGGPLNSLFRLGMAPPQVTQAPKRVQEDFAKTLDEATKSLTTKLTPATERQIRAYIQLGHTIDETAKEFNLSNQEELILSGILDERKRATDETTRAYEQNRKTAAAWLTQFQIDLDLARIRQDELTKATGRYVDAGKLAIRTAETFGELLANPTTPAGQFGFLPGVQQFLPGVDRSMSAWIDSIRVVNAETGRWSDALSVTANQFQRLAQISDGAMSQVVRGIGSGISAVAALDEQLKRVQTTTKVTARDLAGLASTVLTLPLTLANLFGEPGNRFTRMTENREFLGASVSQQFGSLDALQTRLQALGRDGEHLWSQLTAPNHRVHETQRFLDLITQEFGKAADAAQRAGDATRHLVDIIADATFDADQAGRTGIDAVLAQLEHQRQQEIRALEQFSAGDAAMYAQAVEAVTRKYTSLADRAIRDEADRMAQQTGSAVDELTRVSTLLDTIKRHTDAEIASLGQFSSAGQFYDAVITKIRGRQTAAELSSLRRAGQAVAPTSALVSLGGVTVGQIVLQADRDDPALGARLGDAILADLSRKGQRVN